jgi:putative tryptophan/tyrosine transport system substrate-binding protein
MWFQTSAILACWSIRTFRVPETQIKDAEQTARERGVRIQILNASSERDFDTIFATLVQQRVGALVVNSNPLFMIGREQLVALAARHAVPTIYYAREFAAVGGLMSYGTSLNDSSRQSGIYAGRILKGERPADLPVLQPTKFEFVVNLKTAKSLDLTLPPGVLAIADEVIE